MLAVLSNKNILCVFARNHVILNFCDYFVSCNAKKNTSEHLGHELNLDRTGIGRRYGERVRRE